MSEQHDSTRRRFLAGAATVSAAGLAGCLGGGGGTDTATDDGMGDGMDGGMASETDTDGMMTPTEFTVTVTNVSTTDTLQTDEGGKPVPLAPVAWAVHEDANPLFTEGEAASPGLESLAEDGSPKKLVEETKPNVAEAGAAAVPKGADGPGPIKPGDAYEFTVTAHAGQRLSIATMFVQSNDLFYAPGERGMALFGDDEPVSGDVTGKLGLWDAGTEVNQPPGTGADQAPRQSGTDTGADEDGTVRPVADVDDCYDYPAKTDVIEVTVAPGTSDG